MRVTSSSFRNVHVVRSTSFMALEVTDLPVLTTEMSMTFPKFVSLCKVFFVFKFSHF